jgi:FAD/FMN-containing dehydrogenase
MCASTSAAIAARQELRGFGGELIGPDEGAYDEARAVYNAMIDRRPALIARCTGAADVARAIAFAQQHDLPLAVRGGGHNGGGLGVVDDGVVVDLSRLDGVEMDVEARTVRVGGGATWADVDTVTGEAGLATPSGIIATTGVGGLTLGGGIGYITRKYGLTIDNMLAADVVLADGSEVRASADENADLFWALRGGGGNFGVVTSFDFRLNPVPSVVAGPTFWPLEQMPEVMRWYREFIPSAPRELNGWFATLTVPPVPLFPEELHLRKVCAVMWCYLGPAEDAEHVFAPALAVGTPLLHGAAPMPWAALQGLFAPLFPPGMQWYWRADFLRELPDAAIARHHEFAERLPTPFSTMHMYPIDGAVHDVGAADTAFRFRDATWAEVIVGVDPDPAGAGAIRQWTVDYWDATHEFAADGAAYVNFMMDEGQERVQATYGANYPQLARIKTAYDPDNAFRVNQNIRPG